jgi:hypothetical protein
MLAQNFLAVPEIFARNFFTTANSQPEAVRLSSVEDVTATRMMHGAIAGLQPQQPEGWEGNEAVV